MTRSSVSAPDGDHKVLSRSAAMTIAAIALLIGAAVVWVGIEWVESYGNQISVLQALSPDDAATKLANDLKTLATTILLLLGGLSAWVGWYGTRGIRSRSMPPAGSWVVEGRPIRRGRGALIAAWFLVAAAILLALAAGASWFLLRRLAETI